MDSRNTFAATGRNVLEQTIDQRFHTSQFGRYMSADRSRQAAKANDSGSWNKYSYRRGDPINNLDAYGTDDCPASTSKSVTVCADQPPPCNPFLDQFCPLTGGGTNTDQGKGGGASNTSFSAAGLANAKAALKALTTASLDSTDCTKDLADLSRAARVDRLLQTTYKALLGKPVATSMTALHVLILLGILRVWG